jgi:nucleoside-diphosphate-sugar epimerase
LRQDVADATVRALFVERASNTRLVVSAGIMPPEFEIAQFLIARFPELRGRIRMDDSPPRQFQREDPQLDFLDTYLITTILGIAQLRSSEATLTDTVRQMLDLQQRKAWKSITQS